MVDHALQLMGRSRNVQTTVPSLFSAMSIVKGSDLVVTLPRRVAERNARRFDLNYLPLPIDEGTFQPHAVRHEREARSALHLWLVERPATLIWGKTTLALQ